MVVDPRHSLRRALLVGVAIGAACAASEGCSTVEPDIRTTDWEVAEGIRTLREQVSPEDRAVLDSEILWSQKLLVHISLGNLPPDKSRGAESTLASNARQKGWCSTHPESGGVPSRRNWDVILDLPLAAAWARLLGISQPIDALLYHELFGHILPLLRHPEELDIPFDDQRMKILEEKARIKENEYRRYRGLPEVPPYQPKFPHP